MTRLAGLVEELWENVEVRARLKGGDFSKLIESVGDTALALRDVDHAWLNRGILQCFVNMMRAQKSLRLPIKEHIEHVYKILTAKMRNKDGEDYALELDDRTQVALYCAICSTKRLLSFLKCSFNRPHTPRDQGCVKCSTALFLNRFCSCTRWRMCMCMGYVVKSTL